MTVRPGTVYLVGAGPGDPDLITVRGLELLRRADVVLHDRLVAESLLEEARVASQVIDVGKSPTGQAASQHAINAALVAHARDGRVVVRLKGGDPLVFGRGWEERDACAAAGIECEIVPGLSSALAGPAAAGIPVTLRGVASSVAIVAAPAASDERLRAIALADTCVFLMGMHGLESLVQRVIACGRDPATPAAVVERATLPGQQTVRAPLHAIAEAARRAAVRPPAVLVVGATVALDAPSIGPLAGRRIVVTRPSHAAHQLTRALTALGADVLAAPLIRIVRRRPANASWYERLPEHDWIVVSSRHGARGFFAALRDAGDDARRLAHARVAAVGPITARELESCGIRADLCAEPARAEALVSQLLAQRPRPRRVLFPCGTLALETIPDALAPYGIEVERLPVYETRPQPLDERTRAAIGQGVDAVLFASPSAVMALGRDGVPLGDAVAVCIGPTTAAATGFFGWPRVQMAETHSDSGLVEAVVSALGGPVPTPARSAADAPADAGDTMEAA